MTKAIFGNKIYNFLAGSNGHKKGGNKILQIRGQCLGSYKVFKSYISCFEGIFYILGYDFFFKIDFFIFILLSRESEGGHCIG